MCSVTGCDRKPEYKNDVGMICRPHYGRWRKYKSFSRPIRTKNEWATCTVDGCDTKSRTVGGALCEKHYYRKYKTGDLSDPVIQRGRNWFQSAGYVCTYAPLHHLAGKTGAVYLHRAVLFDKIGGGSHQCHWCKDDIEWSVKGSRKLVVDHLDNNKQNNDEGNLVPSCHSCNTSRGLFANWAMKHKDDPFLLRLFTAANDNVNPVCEAV